MLVISREKTPQVNIPLTIWILTFSVDLKQQYNRNITLITIIINFFLPVSSQKTKLRYRKWHTLYCFNTVYIYTCICVYVVFIIFLYNLLVLNRIIGLHWAQIVGSVMAPYRIHLSPKGSYSYPAPTAGHTGDKGPCVGVGVVPLTGVQGGAVVKSAYNIHSTCN